MLFVVGIQIEERRKVVVVDLFHVGGVVVVGGGVATDVDTSGVMTTGGSWLYVVLWR